MDQLTFLKQTVLFGNIPDSNLRQISQDIIERHFEAGEVVFHEGDPGQLMYLVKTG